MIVHMIRYFFCVMLCVGIAHGVHATEERNSQLALTDAVHVGTLESGLTYYLQSNENPTGVVDMRLVVKVGSAYETEYERGLAHFVEHMGFNGTDRYPGNKIISELEQLGVKFGPDLNAYTSFDETVYTLQLTSSNQQDLQTGLAILQQWAFAMELDEVQIRKERGVILEEYRIRESAQQRIANSHINRLFAGTQYVDRLPIGRREVIRGASAAQVRAFYAKWYQPERMAVIVVGDIDPSAVIPYIENMFAAPNKTNNSNNRAARLMEQEDALAEYRLHQDLHTSIAYDPEITEDRAVLYVKRRPTSDETVATYRQSLQFALLSIILNQRFKNISDLPDAALYSANLSFGFQQINHAIEIAALSMHFAPTRAQEAIEAALTEVARFVQHGAGAEEYETATRQLLRIYQQYLAEYPSRTSEFFSHAYTEHFLYGEVLLNAAQEVALAQRIMEDIDPAVLIDSARLLLNGDDRFFSYTGIAESQSTSENSQSAPNNSKAAHKQNIPAHETPHIAYDESRFTPQDITRILETVRTQQLTAVEEKKQRAFIIDPHSLLPTEHTDYEHNAVLDIHRWKYANGIEVILKENDYNTDIVHFNAYSRGGASLYDDAEYADAITAAQIVASGGVHDITPAELRTYLSDKQVSVTPYIRQFTEGIQGTFSVQDVDVYAQLLYAYFAVPRIDPVRFQNWRTRQIQNIQNRENDPMTQLQIRQQELLNGGHIRALPLTVAQIESIDLQKAYSIYKERFAETGAADFTLIFVGNITPSQLQAVLTRYISQLPSALAQEDDQVPNALASNRTPTRNDSTQDRSTVQNSSTTQNTTAVQNSNTAQNSSATQDISIVQNSTPPFVKEEWRPYTITYPDSATQEHIRAGVSERGIARILYFGDYQWELAENTILLALSDYIDILLNQRIRENNSAVYSIGAYAGSMRLPSDRFVLEVFFGSDPEKLLDIIAEIEQIISTVRTTPPTIEVLERIKETQRSQFLRDMQTNEYWVSLIRLSDLYDFEIDDGIERLTRIDALTGEQISNAAKKYLRDNNNITLTLVPDSAQ